MLFAARAGQGLGARCCPRRRCRSSRPLPEGPERAKALAVWGAVGGAGAAIGVLLGGALTELVDWRAIFFVNLPVGVVLAAGAHGISLPRGHGTAADGAASTCAARCWPSPASATLVYALSQAQTQRLDLVADAQASAAPRSPAWPDSPRVELRTRSAAASRAAPRRPCRRRRLRDDARCLRGAVRLLPAVVAVPAERARDRRARDRAGVPAVRRRRSAPASTWAATSIDPRRACGSRSRPASRSRRRGCCCSPASAPDGSYTADVLPGMLVAGIGLGIILVYGVRRGPHGRRRPRDAGCCRASTPPAMRSAARSASQSWPPSPQAPPARPTPPPRAGRRHRRRVPGRRRHRRRRERRRAGSSSRPRGRSCPKLRASTAAWPCTDDDVQGDVARGRRTQHRTRSSTPPSTRWRAIPRPAWPRSRAARASCARRSTCTSRPAKRCMDAVTHKAIVEVDRGRSRPPSRPRRPRPKRCARVRRRGWRTLGRYHGAVRFWP